MSARGGEGRCALTFGYDQSLLSTRQRLLDKTGCKSFVVSSMPDLRAALAKHIVDLVVFCQTVEPEECRTATQLVQQQAPGAQMLIMFNRYDFCNPQAPDGSYVLLDSMAGPSVFVRTAEKMLANAGRSAADHEPADDQPAVDLPA